MLKGLFLLQTGFTTHPRHRRAIAVVSLKKNFKKTPANFSPFPHPSRGAE